jgi:hypothetical protein
MGDSAKELNKLTDDYRKSKAVEAFDRIEAMSKSKRLEIEDPATHLKANIWIVERGLGKTPDKLDINIENAPWAVALRNSVRGLSGQAPIPVDSTEVMPPLVPSDDEDDEWLTWDAAS